MAGLNFERVGTQRQRRIAGVVLVGLLALGSLVLYTGGLFGNGAGGPTDPLEQAGGAPPSEDHVRPFSIDIRSITECGATCRDVTVTITNNGGSPRENVTVSTTIFTDNESVWHRNESAGTLDGGESLTRTRRIKVGVAGGNKIKQNDGRVLIQTVVRWEGGSAVFTERRDLT